MRKIFLALMAVAAIALTGCENPKNEGDPNPPENGRNNITCTCGNRYTFTYAVMTSRAKSQSDYEVYASGEGGGGNLSLTPALEKYPFVTYSVDNISVGYFFWRCECGRYHKVMKNNLTHTEIPSGEQPEEWNKYNYLWE